MRIIEKHLRDEVINRCIEFLDVAIHFILYIEQIYSKDLFEKRLKYNLIVHECHDTEVQHYVSEFLNQIKSLLRKHVVDQIGFVITTDNDNDLLRRYLIELRPIIDCSSNTIHQNGYFLLAELDSIFSTCLIELMRQTPISPLNLSTEHDDGISGNNEDNDEHNPVRWRLQMRLCSHGNSSVEIEDTFYEQHKLADNCSTPLKQIKSAHAQRLNIQLMCQDKL